MEAQLRWWVVRTKHIISIWSLPHSAVHSWLRSRHMKKQRSTLYRKWASYGFDMTNIKIHNWYSEKIKSSYIVITHCYHHIYHMDRFHSKDFVDLYCNWAHALLSSDITITIWIFFTPGIFMALCLCIYMAFFIIIRFDY